MQFVSVLAGDFDWRGNQGLIDQIFQFIYDRGPEGASQVETEVPMGILRSNVRAALKLLCSKGLCTTVLRQRGRQKINV
jgi:hypothetical protein